MTKGLYANFPIIECKCLIGVLESTILWRLVWLQEGKDNIRQLLSGRIDSTGGSGMFCGSLSASCPTFLQLVHTSVQMYRMAALVAWSPIRSKAQNANVALPISHCGYYTLLPLSFTNSAIWLFKSQKLCKWSRIMWVVSDPKCSQKIVRVQSLLIKCNVESTITVDREIFVVKKFSW